MVRMKIRRRIGQKGQIVIPKVVRESAGIEPGDEIIMEVREKEVVIRPGTGPEEFIESFCLATERKLNKKLDLEKLLEQEVEERLALH